MSYNIDSIKVLSSTLRLPRENWEKAKALDLPDGNFIERLREESFVDTYAPLREFQFCGEGSGYAYNDGVFGALVAITVGEADLVLVWEGGDSLSGVRIRDGEMTECDVGFVLKDKASR